MGSVFLFHSAVSCLLSFRLQSIVNFKVKPQIRSHQSVTVTRSPAFNRCRAISSRRTDHTLYGLFFQVFVFPGKFDWTYVEIRETIGRMAIRWCQDRHDFGARLRLTNPVRWGETSSKAKIVNHGRPHKGLSLKRYILWVYLICQIVFINMLGNSIPENKFIKHSATIKRVETSKK